MSTITAISTPVGVGGIGIIRISGEKSLEIINKIFRKKKKTDDFKSYTMKYGYIFDNEEMIDEVLVSYFKAPNSYTGEDVCEINCHGGILIMRRILEAVLKNGAILAEPGEFTKRAFLNGKMDLSQAEAVMDMIHSKSIKENKASIQQLEGYLGRKINEIKESVIEILVDIEASIDYPEYDLEEVQREKIEKLLKKGIEKLEELEQTFENGKILKEGINTVIIGKPNVGKSSLMNTLLREERAIVTDIAGTTRDTIEEQISIKGIPLKIVDTAGIHETKDVVEEIGVEKSKKALENADLVLLLLDATGEIQEEDKQLLEVIQQKKFIILINKIDAERRIQKEEIIQKYLKNKENEGNIIEISAKEEIGIAELENKIEEMFHFSQIDVNQEIIVTNERHRNAIIKAKTEMKKVLKENQERIPMDMLSIELQNAIQHLGEITGESVNEEVINGIFKKFCLGK